MARTNNSQRRIQTRQAATIATLGAAHTMFISARWFLLCGAAINHAIESRTLSSKYFVSYYDKGQNMLRMIYASDVASVVTTRMDIYTFTKLCKILENRGGLSNCKNMLVDEQVAMFLHTLAHNEKNRNIGIMFKRSGETICRYFKLVLNAVCRVHKEFYKEPVPIPDDEIDERWKWFKGCLGALDGTYVKVRVPASDRKPYRSRKGEICTNVLGVCTRDLQFTYVLAGWEGSAADSRVLRDAISRPNGLKVPHGNYYLKAVEQLLDKSLPNSGLKAEPHIKSRMKTLKLNFTIVHDMIAGTSTSGFGFKWDSGKGCVDAEEQVWDEYIKTHKNAANFRGKPLPFYEKLCTIFGKDRATGSHAIDLGEEDIVEETPTSPIEVDMDTPPSGGTSGSASNKRKRSKSDDFSEIFKECSNDLTKRIEHSIGSLGEKIVASAHETIAGDILEEVITEIQNLPGISAHQRLKGMDIIGGSTSKARIFLRSSEEDKVLYIQMLAKDALD